MKNWKKISLAGLGLAGVTVSLEFEFSPARFKDVNGEYKPFPWAARFWNYQETDGMRILLEGEVECPKASNRIGAGASRKPDTNLRNNLCISGEHF